MPHDFARPVCHPAPEAEGFGDLVMRTMNYDVERQELRLYLQGEGFAYVRVSFERVSAFRVMDERELTPFWESGSHLGNGWLWEVESGGWLDLETTRPGFALPAIVPDINEYLFVCDTCVSVLTPERPVVRDERRGALV